MKYFMDTEFIEQPNTIELISIGIVAEDGREFYAENDAVDWSLANPWVLENVKPHLNPVLHSASLADIRNDILDFAPPEEKPEFWAYYGAYDWVAFAWLFGPMIDLPSGYPMYVRDIKQLAESLGNPELPEQQGTAHNALEDARHNRVMYEFLRALEVTKC